MGRSSAAPVHALWQRGDLCPTCAHEDVD